MNAQNAKRIQCAEYVKKIYEKKCRICNQEADFYHTNSAVYKLNMQKLQDNMHNLQNMQTLFQYAEYTLPTLLMQQACC